MVFSSLVFLLIFLPVVISCYLLVPARFKNIALLLFSLFFYAWGEGRYLAIMLFSVGCCYGCGLTLGIYTGIKRKIALGAGITALLLPLLYFKYGAFLLQQLDSIWGIDLGSVRPQLTSIHLPLGISFFTFQALSYLVDVYRKTTVVQKNLFSLALYISLFPQLVAGPIVRYHDIAGQLLRRTISVDLVYSGVERFIIGLAKKVLLANSFGQMADTIFALPASDVSLITAWLGAVSYALQIYFDFSGYSDMAIGLGRVFGFNFLENFNYPYISRSIKEFWHRWHISLSNWFRDYLYIPLGGNRKGPGRTVVNLFVVFLLCGLWHGASWTFVVWGLFHGSFLALERGPLGRFVEKLPTFFQHVYVLVVVVVAWVFFRADSLAEASVFIGSMFGATGFWHISYKVAAQFNCMFIAVFLAGIIFSCPVHEKAGKLLSRFNLRAQSFCGWSLHFCYILSLYVAFILCLASLATGTYNPFIYFRF